MPGTKPFSVSGRNLSMRFFAALVLVVVLTSTLVTTALAQSNLLQVYIAEIAQTEQCTQDQEFQSIVLSQNEASLFETFSAVKDLIQTYHTKDVSDKVLYEGAIRGMLEALNDPYSQYLTEEEMDALSSDLEGEYVGIGVTIDLINGEITVVGTFTGSPAEKAGIKPGDVIIAVDGKSLQGKAPQDASLVLRGDQNTQVTVDVKRPSTGQILTFKLTRAMITPPTLSLKDMGNGIFYVQISQFTSSTGQDFSVIMNYLRSRNLRGLILDLRGNPGGLLDSAIAVAKELVPKGPIVELRRKDLKEVIQNDNDITPVPVAVLTDSGTASASEIVAGAIRDRGVGILIGEKTFGKACVQSIIPLGNGMGGIRLTIADYYTPLGRSLAGTGLQPDVPVTPEVVEPPAKIDYKRPLRQGVVGLDVLALQQALSFLGYDVGKLDGIFGPMTDQASSAFCKQHNLKYEGQVDAKTIDAINLAVIEKSTKVEDRVLDTAMEFMGRRLATGVWLAK